MEVSKGFKLVLSKIKGKSSIEITRHGDPVMDNILIVNSVGSTRYQDTWIIEKDLPGWLSSLKGEGFTEIKTIEDAEASKKNNKKKK